MAHNYVLICGYDNMGTGSTDLLRKFAVASSSSTGTTNPTTPFGTGRWCSPGFGVTFTLPAASASVIIGQWCYIGTLQQIMLMGALQSGSYQFTVGVDIVGRITVYRGNFGTLLATSSPVISPASWFHLEIKSKVSSSISSGDFVIYINGVQVLSLSAATNTQNTGTANMDQVIYGTGFAAFYVDDTYIIDWSSGDSTQVGSKRVHTLIPNGNGTTSNFVGSDSNSTDNYLLVDETTIDTADYTGSDVVSDVDLYAMSNLSVTPTSIPVIQVVNTVANSDAGARTGRNLIRSGGANYEGSSYSPGTSYLMQSSMWYTDPQDSAAWTKAKVDALEAGIKVQT